MPRKDTLGELLIRLDKRYSGSIRPSELVAEAFASAVQPMVVEKTGSDKYTVTAEVTVNLEIPADGLENAKSRAGFFIGKALDPLREKLKAKIAIDYTETKNKKGTK